MAEPIIAEPEIHGSIELDESCRFLLLMSRGLYKSLEEATGTDQVNKELALIAVEQVSYLNKSRLNSSSHLKSHVQIHFETSMILVSSTIDFNRSRPSGGRQGCKNSS